MFFTFVAKMIAWALTIVGALNAVFMIGVSSGWLTASTGTMAMMTRSRTVGESIDYNLYLFAIGVLIGVLADISKSVRALQNEP